MPYADKAIASGERPRPARYSTCPGSQLRNWCRNPNDGLISFEVGAFSISKYRPEGDQGSATSNKDSNLLSSSIKSSEQRSSLSKHRHSPAHPTTIFDSDVSGLRAQVDVSKFCMW